MERFISCSTDFCYTLTKYFEMSERTEPAESAPGYLPGEAAAKKGRIDKSVLDEPKDILMEKLHQMNG